jgi:murein DD-endopeptidase MepM/ murein hydrolase activator NlpD
MLTTHAYVRTTAVLVLTAVLGAATAHPSAAAPRPAAVDPRTVSVATGAANAARGAEVKTARARARAELGVVEPSVGLGQAEGALDATRERLTQLSALVDQVVEQRREAGDRFLDVVSGATDVAADVAGAIIPAAKVFGPFAAFVDANSSDRRLIPQPDSAEHDLRMARAKAIRDQRTAADDVANPQQTLDAAAGALAAARKAEQSAIHAAATAGETADAVAASLGIDNQLARPAVGDVSSPYGMRTHPVTGAFKAHTGIDFGYGDGLAYAAAEGTVEEVRFDSAYGNLITIAHGTGINTRYAHLAGTSVRPGERVSAGQVVGRIGATGLATGPHLHFEIQVNGRFQDPADWLGR